MVGCWGAKRAWEVHGLKGRTARSARGLAHQGRRAMDFLGRPALVVRFQRPARGGVEADDLGAVDPGRGAPWLLRLDAGAVTARVQAVAIDDSDARADWGWKPAYDLNAMTADMLAELKKKHDQGLLV